MNFNHLHYVPCLKWKQGEYQAVLRLPEPIRNMITPLIEVPVYSFDFEKKEKPKTLDELIEPFAKRVHDKWGKKPCFVDVKNIPNPKNLTTGKHPIAYIFDELFEMDCSPIPVTGIERDSVHQREIKKVVSKNKLESICLRVAIEEFAKSRLESRLRSVLKTMGTDRNKTHLIIDLGAPNFVPIGGFSKAIYDNVCRQIDLSGWLTFSIIGTSIPNFFKKGISILPRYEWLLYKELSGVFRRSRLRLPTFGDYAITHPAIPPDLDWSIISSAAKIKYTIDDGWYLVKGKSLRDGPTEQFHDMCRSLVGSPHFTEQELSSGDKFIKKCATDRTLKTRQHRLWITAGTDHHVVKVVSDIANFYASS